MPLITKFERGGRTPKLQPTQVVCVFHSGLADNGKKLLQLDTGGSAHRENPGKQSQTIQLDEKSGHALWKLLGSEFGFEA